MFVRKIGAVGVTAAVAAGIALTAMAPANAATPFGGGAVNPSQEKYYDLANSGLLSNATVQSGAILAAGSDTIQFLDGALAESYNTSKTLTAGAAGSFTSLAACDVPAADASILTSCATPTSKNFSETFPSVNPVAFAGSSGSGSALLLDSSKATNKDFAFSRASGSQQTAQLANLPFAVDELVAAVSNKVTSNAPASISRQELLGIYSGVYTNWKQLGGKDAPIHAYYIANSGSGTYQYFGKQLYAEAGGTAPSSGAYNIYQPSGTVSATTSFVSSKDLSGKDIIEHDPSSIENDPDAIGALSYSRVILSAKENGGSATDISKAVIKPLSGFVANRPMYSVMRDKATTPATGLTGVPTDWVYDGAGTMADTNIYKTLLGPNGYFCSATAKPIIEAQGFFQLPSGICGVPVGTTGDPAIKGGNGMHTVSSVALTATSSEAEGQSTVTAVVSSKDSSVTTAPSGTVTFKLIPKNVPGGAKVFGGTFTAPLTAGTTGAVKVPATIASGTYQVSVAYSGDTTFQGNYTDGDTGTPPVPAYLAVVAPAGPSPAVVAAEKAVSNAQAALNTAKGNAVKAAATLKTASSPKTVKAFIKAQAKVTKAEAKLAKAKTKAAKKKAKKSVSTAKKALKKAQKKAGSAGKKYTAAVSANAAAAAKAKSAQTALTKAQQALAALPKG